MVQVGMHTNITHDALALTLTAFVLCLSRQSTAFSLTFALNTYSKSLSKIMWLFVYGRQHADLQAATYWPGVTLQGYAASFVAISTPSLVFWEAGSSVMNLPSSCSLRPFRRPVPAECMRRVMRHADTRQMPALLQGNLLQYCEDMPREPLNIGVGGVKEVDALAHSIVEDLLQLAVHALIVAVQELVAPLPGACSKAAANTD